MSVQHRAQRPGEKIKPGIIDEIQNNIAQITAAGEKTAAVLSTLFQAQVTADRATDANIITDEMIMQAADVLHFPDWIKGAEYKRGDILESTGLLIEALDTHIATDDVPIREDAEHYRIIFDEQPKRPRKGTGKRQKKAADETPTGEKESVK